MSTRPVILEVVDIRNKVSRLRAEIERIWAEIDKLREELKAHKRDTLYEEWG